MTQPDSPGTDTPNEPDTAVGAADSEDGTYRFGDRTRSSRFDLDDPQPISKKVAALSGLLAAALALGVGELLSGFPTRFHHLSLGSATS